MKYSFKTGLIKWLISLLSVAGMVLAFTAFSDMTLWGLLEQYLKPILGSLTIGGGITLLINWLKVKSKIGKLKKAEEVK